MRQKIDRNQSSNNSPDRWNKPIGKIGINAIGGVIAGIVLIFIGIGINRSCTRVKPPNQVATDKKSPEKNTEKREDATHQTPPIKKQQKVDHEETLTIKQKNPEKSEQPTINAPNSVISVNQQGGITAHTINLSPPNRNITQEQREILINRLKPIKFLSIEVGHGLDNQEKIQFAKKLIEALNAAGCKLEVKTAVMFIEASLPGDGLNFLVNSNPPYPHGATELQQALKEAKIDSHWFSNPDFKRDVIYMVIGNRP